MWRANYVEWKKFVSVVLQQLHVNSNCFSSDRGKFASVNNPSPYWVRFSEAWNFELANEFRVNKTGRCPVVDQRSRIFAIDIYAEDKAVGRNGSLLVLWCFNINVRFKNGLGQTRWVCICFRWGWPRPLIQWHPEPFPDNGRRDWLVRIGQYSAPRAPTSLRSLRPVPDRLARAASARALQKESSGDSPDPTGMTHQTPIATPSIATILYP